MWISEEVARQRINSSANILNRISRETESAADYPVKTPDFNPATISDEIPKDTPDELTPEILAELHAVMQAPDTKPAKRNWLTHREAADAVVVGQLTDFNHASTLFDRTKRHLEQTGQFGNQGHLPGQYTPGHEVAQLIEFERTKIRNAAYNRLEHTLSCLSDEKINKVAKARDLTSIAVQLATVADKMLPKDMRQDESVHLHIFRPEVRKSADYDVIEVGAERVGADIGAKPSENGNG